MKKTIQECEPLLGARGTAAIVGGPLREVARQWLQARGVSRAIVAVLSQAEIRAAYNDTSDAALNAVIARNALAAPAPTPTNAPASPDPRLVLEQIASIFGGAKGGLGAEEVRTIVDGETSPINSRIADLEEELETLRPLAALAARAATDAVTARRLPVLAAAVSGNKVVDWLARFYKAGQPTHNSHVLLLSPPSYGKSYGVRIFGKGYDVFLEHGCSPEADEVSTLLGSFVPDGKGGFSIVDGVITQAVRAASSGRSVLLFLDETFRLNESAQQWLLLFLTTVDVKGVPTYRLRTRKPDGNILEVIECPAANLHLVAASNLGYVKPFEALWSRLNAKLRLDWSLSDCTAIAKSILDKYGIPSSGLPEKFANLIGATRTTTKSGSCAYPVDFRLLECAAAHCATQDEAGVTALIKELAVAHSANWDLDLGDTDAKARETITQVLKAV